jgi:hypothetical protein
MWSSRFLVIWHRWCCRTRRSSTISCFSTSAETLLEVARNPKRLGVEIGFFSVLHGWSQKLETHPNVHCVVPAGGWSPDHTHRVSASAGSFFLVSCCVLTLLLDEFLRRLLLHVLPKGSCASSTAAFWPTASVRPTCHFASSYSAADDAV